MKGRAADALAAALGAIGVALLCVALLDGAAYGRFLVSLLAR